MFYLRSKHSFSVVGKKLKKINCVFKKIEDLIEYVHLKKIDQTILTNIYIFINISLIYVYIFVGNFLCGNLICGIILKLILLEILNYI